MADTFADGIVPVAAPNFSGLLTQPDPMLFAPKPGIGTRILDTLAGGFGQGPDRIGNYAKGVELGSQVRLRSAQTESALAEADKRRAETLRQSQINDLITRAQSNPNFQPSVSDLLTIATGAADLTHGQLNQQEMTQRALVADPNAAPAAVSAARAALAPGTYNQYYQPATGMIANNATGAAPTVTPVGQATIAATHALEGQRERSQPGGFTLGGVRYNADGTPVVAVDEVAANAARVAAATAAARYAAKPGTATKPPNATQMKAIGQLNRMERTEDILNSPELQGYVPSLATTAAARVPGIGNMLVDPQFQKYTQAAREWISGLLRLDSGAAVPETEFARYFQTFFPQPGDDEAVIAQKAEARTWATNSLRGSLGDVAPARGAPGTAPSPTPAAPPASAPAVHAFNTVAEAEAANLPPGTRITVGGRPATVK